ncbi:amino acid ABC transporter permease [Acuticoccus mangrovi]|uniref:Amino acid ABC transporter permease n=1 Tax=Acuticoccus mangrovi TaxID=2796142 RepID=A0A934ING6_9HYPH|nr:amino acid ABC transporter permease [Acuticoccus mangrovi]MBJ3777107.1 amino acid ABC transporter permease [Acuticoccus mangrovi]
MNFSVITDNLYFLSTGLWTTVHLTVFTLIGGLLLGTPLALARASGHRVLRLPALLLIETIRGIPVLMLIFWIYFLLPHLVGAVPAYTAGLVALIVFNTAYSAEIVRAGINSIDHGNVEAGRATGLNLVQILRHIVLPQAFANMTPALMSQAVMVYKTTSVVFVIGIVDLFRAATIVNNREFKPIEIFAFVALVYFIPCTIVSRYTRRIEIKRMIRHGTFQKA